MTDLHHFFKNFILLSSKMIIANVFVFRQYIKFKPTRIYSKFALNLKLKTDQFVKKNKLIDSTAKPHESFDKDVRLFKDQKKQLHNCNCFLFLHGITNTTHCFDVALLTFDINLAP